VKISEITQQEHNAGKHQERAPKPARAATEYKAFDAKENEDRWPEKLKNVAG
jgi:hypothetical protein